MMTSSKQTETDVDVVAQEINQYLSEHPNAADSLEGIVSWWLTRIRYNNTNTIVQKALEKLVAEGIVVKVVRQGNKTIYSCKGKYN